jgi:hypothetical protein
VAVLLAIPPAYADIPGGVWSCRTGDIGPTQEFGADIGTLSLSGARYTLTATNSSSGSGALGEGTVGFAVIDGPLVADFAITRGDHSGLPVEMLSFYADASPLPVIGCTRTS